MRWQLCCPVSAPLAGPARLAWPLLTRTRCMHMTALPALPNSRSGISAPYHAGPGQQAGTFGKTERATSSAVPTVRSSGNGSILLLRALCGVAGIRLLLLRPAGLAGATSGRLSSRFRSLGGLAALRRVALLQANVLCAREPWRRPRRVKQE